MSNMTYEQVSANKVQTNLLTVGDTQVSGISVLDTDKLLTQLTTSYALFTGLSKLQAQINVLNDLGFGVENVVISPPIVSPVFADTSYVYSGWEIYDQLAVYIGDEPNNFLQLPHTLFATNLHYLLNINVHTLPNGHLELKDNDGDIIAVIDKIGDYYYDVIADSDTSFKIVAVGVEFGKQVSLSYLSVHKVSTQFYNYLFNKIKELSSVDGQGYVDKVLFEARMDDIENMFNLALGDMNTALADHLADKNNPHDVTPFIIGAADRIHTHDDRYYLKDTVGEMILQAMSTRAALDHIHLSYTTMGEVIETVNNKITDAVKAIHTVTPLCLLEGPFGILPESFTHMGMTPPTQLLISNMFKHDTTGEYDINSGLVSCNKVAIMGTTIIDAISTYGENNKLAKFRYPSVTPTDDKVVIHYQFHRSRKLLGYKVRGLADGYATKWALYSNFNTFVHTVQNNGFVANGFEVMLPDSIHCNSLALEVLETSNTDWAINIEFIFDDISTGHIGVTEEPVLLSIPRGGNNLIFTLDLDNLEDLSPPHKIEGLPVYVVLDVDDTGKEQLDYTYIPPEYGTIRNGIDVFRDRFSIGVLTNTDLRESVNHPVFGVLSVSGLSAGVVCENILTTIYNTGGTWATPPDQSTATITHEFHDPTFMVGYDLEWDKTYIAQLPTDWTLHLTVLKEDGTTEIVVVDSVTMYGSKFNYDTESILYCKKFSKAYHVTKMELFLNNTHATGLCITNFKPMITRDFYNVPKNTMYYGDAAVTRMYFGVAEFHEGDFKINSQLTIGKTCHVPVNNLELTRMGTEYRIVNPYHTTDVSCSVRVIGGDLSIPPLCSVVDVREDVITLVSYSMHLFVLTIVRNW